MRDDFSQGVKRTVAERVNYLCSNLSCRAATSGPQEDPSKSLNIGVAAHITAASEGGPRYNPALTTEERRHANNAIWLCQNCGKLIDNDEATFTETEIRRWKRTAETEAFSRIGKTATSTGLAHLCSSEEGLQIDIEELIGRVRAATSEMIYTWLRHQRLAGRPQIALQAVRLGHEYRETEEFLDLGNIHASMKLARSKLRGIRRGQVEWFHSSGPAL